jgi:isobutyryl-CoA mutase
MDALRDVAKQVLRNREAFGKRPDDMPVFGTMASRFNDEGVSAVYHYLLKLFNEQGKGNWQSKMTSIIQKYSDIHFAIIPPDRNRYLAEIVNSVRDYKKQVKILVKNTRSLQQLKATREMLVERNYEVHTIDELIQEHEELQTSEARISS